jgi:hypothetical protein
MSALTKSKRQSIIDGYLATTGHNMFVAAEFIDWLSGQPEHEAYEWFFGEDDATAAREHRIALARRMASGLRIVANVSEPPSKGQVVQISVREYPAFVSPVAGRRTGGGYEPFNPDDASSMAELQRQGATALRSWLARYSGAAAHAGVKIDAIEKIAAALESNRVAIAS